MRLFLFFVFVGLQVKSQVIYNAYANITNYSGTSFTVNNLTEPASFSFAVGGNVILMQIQDNVIGTNTANVATFGDIAGIQSAGLWEERTINAINRSGTNATITLNAAPTNTYNTGNNSRFQLISLRRLSAGAFTTTNNITATPWNGDIGGVVAIEVGTDLTLNHNISADGIGFRGGVVSNNNGSGCTTGYWTGNSNERGEKGEGIYRRTDNNLRYGQAKLINGGGGGIFHNGGGGGGGNWTAGGPGGPGWNGNASGCTPGAGGIGGLSLSTFFTTNRIFMGGGGGGAQQNNGYGSGGANGGGIVIIKANRIITVGPCGAPLRISANGNSASNTGGGGFNDAAGGGGAAGTVVLQVANYSISPSCSLHILANGGMADQVQPHLHMPVAVQEPKVLLFFQSVNQQLIFWFLPLTELQVVMLAEHLVR